jgi:threonine/homoserine/homoserine lactone efflux protein
MMDTSGLVSTAVVFGLSAGFSPGPLMTLVITETLKGGASAGLRIAVAPLITDAPIIAGSLLLLAAFAHAMTFIGVVALLGGLFIARMGYANITFAGVDSDNDALRAPPLRTGIIANLLNPHPYLFWMTVGSPLILNAGRLGTGSIVLFLTAFYGCLVGSKMLVAVAVGRSRRFLRSRAYIWIIRALGVLLLVFAGLFFREGVGYLVS